MTSKKTGAESRVVYEPAIMVKWEAEMESAIIGSATMDHGE
jgi:hypothetical protein